MAAALIASAPLKRRALDMLMLDGSWVSRSELDALSAYTPALDDALADLVVEGLAEFKQGIGYRLAGGPLVRASVKRLMKDPALSAFHTARQIERVMHVGVARRHPTRDGELLVYSYALPEPATDAEAAQQATALAQLYASGPVAPSAAGAAREVAHG